MSEPTLYRIDKSQLDGVFYEGGHWAIMADEAIETLIDRCVLVPVEPDVDVLADTQSSISEARMSEPTIFIVRGHTSTCECRIDDCFVEVEEPVYRKCQRCQGRAGWTEPNTLEWVECEAPGCDFGVVEIGGDENA